MEKYSHRRPGAIFFSLSFGIFVVIFGISRFVLIYEVAAASVAPKVLFIDLAMAVCISMLIVILKRIHILVSAAFLIFLTCFYIASMEMAVALNTFINIADIRYVTDIHFIRSNMLNLTFPWYSIFLLLSAIVYLVALKFVERKKPLKLIYIVLYMFISICSIHFLTPKGGDWHSSNLFWLTVSRSIQRPVRTTEHQPASKISADALNTQKPYIENKNDSYFHKSPHDERNVLIVVLEGIPGVYLRQVQEWTGVKYPVEMPNLSSIAEKSLIVPNFIAHNRQTMRGLYSLLSGDYSKLAITTPKVYEYVQLPRESRNPCLPEILAKAGYRTVYLQAADLAFMSKDKFMPESGFNLVLGKDYFQYQHIPFGWGPDDKAFFEQAAEFIENLDRQSRPWFLTLLNVGTHHPYAVPTVFIDTSSSRKEAVVAYLDEALGDFIERLGEGGILDDTLVIVTSDESHGVIGQPYGNFWGLILARSPESSFMVNSGVFGLIDIPYSVLDYLGLTVYSHSFPKRSIFREQNVERTILFGSYASKRKGIVQKRINSNCVKIIQSSNGELFSPTYKTKIVDGVEGRELSAQLLAYQTAADNSLIQYEGKERKYILLKDDVFIVGSNESRLLSSGQYLNIPGGTTVTVELEATAELIDGYDVQGINASIRLVLQMIKYYKKMSFPEICIPVLKNQDSLRLSFSFYTEEPLTRVWAYLKAVSVNHSHATRLTIERFSIESEECESKHGFRVNCFLIEEKGGRKYDLKSMYFSDGQRNTVSILQHKYFSNAYVGADKMVHNSISTKEFSITPEKRSEEIEIYSYDLRPSLHPVAHAGGGFQGLTYTNSVEALEENADSFTLFEIDLEWTRDDQLVGLHDWGDCFTKIFGFDVEGPLDYITFRELKTVTGITPLDLPLIKEFLQKNPSAKIITDAKSNNTDAIWKIARFFPDFAERFIPQVYQPDEFSQAIEIGYRNVIWTLYRYCNIYDPVAVLSHIRNWEDEYNIKPFAVTMPVCAAERGIAKVMAMAGIPVYVHTVNTCDEYVRLLGLGVVSIYTDFLDVKECYSIGPPSSCSATKNIFDLATSTLFPSRYHVSVIIHE
jgi:glycerophosphoryl diester phosphodiesterase